ncbi:MAG: NUDIX domain-containing protein [Oscillospiraceae bacterium]|nr:NUDIX domain-containing protein [Oscillospiraceae bacterium]
MTDITLKAGDGFFIYKAGAIIIHENNILMVKNDTSPYYYPVGGRVRFGETSESAVIREVYEETMVTFEIDRLAFIHENFFVADFMDNVYCHEIGLYYLMKQSANVNKNLLCNSVSINGVRESLQWLPLDKLSDYHLFPEFFKTELKNLKNGIGHFITKNEKTSRAK